MFRIGAVLLAASAAMAGFYGLATSFADVLSRVIPGIAYGTPRWVGRMGGSDAWQHVVQPILAMPCWAPFLVLGGMFILFGLVRRL